MKNYDIDFILNKITKKGTDKIDLFGVSVALLYSKEAFLKNQDIASFLKYVYNIDFLPYIMRSRTLIAARITRELNNKTEEELIEIKTAISEYLNKLIQLNIEEDSQEQTGTHSDRDKKPKKKDANEKMKTWLEGI